MKQYNINLLNKYFDYLKKTKKDIGFLSEKTVADLEIELLFNKLNNCNSKIGEQYFFALLKVNKNFNLLKINSLYQYFKNNEKDRLQVNKELQKINNIRDYDIIDLIEQEIFINDKYYKYAQFSLFSTILIILSSFFIPKMVLLLIPFFIGNLIFHYLNKNFVEYYNSIIFRLQTILSVSEKLKQIPILKNELDKINTKKIKNNLAFAYFEKALVTNEYLSILWVVIEIFKIIFLVEIFTFRKKAEILNNSKEELLKLYEAIGFIDTSINVFEIRKNYKTCEPIFVDNKEIRINNIYHPFIENCIENSFELKDKSMVITGSNMSGKTSFMRKIATNTIFAQNFGFCFADYFSIPRVQILSSISVNDDISENKSYYLEEVLRIKDFLKERTGFSLILIDEIFKGTNTKERIAISKAVLQNLNTSENIVFITTHDLEIANFLRNQHYDLYYFDEDIKENELYFPYQLKRGINNKTNAIKILEMYDYPKNIVNLANKLAND